MPFKITITKVEEKKTVKEGPHTIIREEPWSAEDLRDEKQSYESKEDFIKRRPVKHVYGYAPAMEATEIVETKILEQTVEELNMIDVVRAINHIHS